MSMSQELSRDLTSTALKVSPGLAASAWTWDSLVVLLTVIFLLMQMGYLAWKWSGERRDRKAREASAGVGRHPEDE